MWISVAARSRPGPPGGGTSEARSVAGLSMCMSEARSQRRVPRGAFRSWAARVERSWRCPLFTVRPLRRGHSVVDYSAPPRGPACHSSVGRHRARAAFPALGVQRRELRPLPVRSAQSRDGPAPVHRACPVVPGALPGDRRRCGGPWDSISSKLGESAKVSWRCHS